MNWTRTILDLIDMRSFSNLWYWIALAVTWSQAAHWVIGVPFDMVLRARRLGGQAESDLDDMVRAGANRILYIAHVAGSVVLAVLAFVLTSLAVLGFVYGMEFAQAVALILLPLSLVWGMNLRLADRVARDRPTGAALQTLLWRHRFKVQIVGIVAIFITAIWGMLQNFNVSILN